MSLVQIYLNVNVEFQGFISRVDPTTKQESHVAYLRGATTLHVAEPGTEWRFSIPEAESYITTDAPVQNVEIAPSPTGGFKVIVHGLPTLFFIPKSTSATFYLFLLKGAKDRAKELGYTIAYQGPASESEVASQVDFVRNITRSKPAGILLAALDSKALIPPVVDADKDGVPVVMVDSGIDSDIPKASITTDNYKGGYVAGLAMAKLLGEKGLVANLGIQASSVSSARNKGFIDAIARCPNMTVLPIQWTKADAAASMNIAKRSIESNPNIAGFFSPCAPTAVGVCQAIKGEGLEKKVKVVTFDPSPEVLPWFESGVIDCIIAQDFYQMGYQGVDFIDKARKNTPIKKKNVELPPVEINLYNYRLPEVQKLLQTPEKF